MVLKTTASAGKISPWHPAVSLAWASSCQKITRAPGRRPAPGRCDTPYRCLHARAKKELPGPASCSARAATFFDLDPQAGCLEAGA